MTTINPAERIDFNGMPATRLRAPDGSEAIVLDHGAHVVSWKPRGGPDRLYLSPDAVFEQGTAVRGGVPICFPQFANNGPLPSHGFARKSNWELVDARGGEDYAMANLRLRYSDATLAEWPGQFVLELAISVSGDRLDLEMDVLNDGEESFSFTAALHTYLAVKEVEECALEGLRGQDCSDSLTKKRFRETGTSFMVDQEVDRIYHGTKNALLLREHHRALAIHSENLPDTVVWNPWVERSKQLKDLPDNGFRRMLCVEGAVVESPVVLGPQQSWWGRQTLMVL
ncbi:MAG: D-hexose-6-phosphate mutarotase [Rhodocyclaceae bacterium]